MPQTDIALAIVQRHPHLLIAQRLPHVHFGSYYEFPGGKHSPPESPAESALRELQEETTVIAQILRPLPLIEHTYPYATLCFHPFLCQYLSGTPQPIACQRALWILPQNLRHYRFPPANTPLLKLLDSLPIEP